jgi:hypothetical protein
MKTNSMIWQATVGWTSQPGYSELAWQCGCRALHKDPNLSTNRLAQTTELELGAPMLAVRAASLDLRPPHGERQ